MQHTELHEEITGLAASLDDHISSADAATALRALADRVEAEGLAGVEPEQVFTPDAPRYPEVSVNLIGEDASILSIVTRVRTALRRHGVEPDVLDELVTTVTGKGGYEAALHEVTCWVSVGTPGVDDED